MKPRSAQSGMTLIETMVVVAIIAVMAGMAFPSFTAGLDGLRLRSASSTVASALNIAITTADRRQLPVQLAIQPAQNRIVLRVADSKRDQIFEIPAGIRIRRILPALFLDEEKKDRYLLVYPNGAPPQLIVELENPRGSIRQIKLDPITGIAQVFAQTAPEVAHAK
ncbi:prepilin-type N-terminal cleavage/methylation domain-containing protein [Bryobacter aggregatus]|uniref:prepilin-type N-terminal cleavage/methylation domain-containing protein n=1 Tax=Bryobacter aggregatus TaxID=360054 RepID=UPI0009B5BD74|nr:prepilin-type N-terminal cleavage/methylation domain-containing protein [Bryobacter aggregatus]